MSRESADAVLWNVRSSLLASDAVVDVEVDEYRPEDIWDEEVEDKEGLVDDVGWLSGGGGRDWHMLKNSEVRSWDVIVVVVIIISIIIIRITVGIIMESMNVCVNFLFYSLFICSFYSLFICSSMYNVNCSAKE
jgi:hypothetical protein